MFPPAFLPGLKLASECLYFFTAFLSLWLRPPCPTCDFLISLSSFHCFFLSPFSSSLLLSSLMSFCLPIILMCFNCWDSVQPHFPAIRRERINGCDEKQNKTLSLHSLWKPRAMAAMVGSVETRGCERRTHRPLWGFCGSLQWGLCLNSSKDPPQDLQIQQQSAGPCFPPPRPLPLWMKGSRDTTKERRRLPVAQG